MTGRIGPQAGVLTGAKLITMTMSFAASMVLARYATLEELGTLSQTLVSVNLITTALMLGLPNSVTYFMAGEPDVSNRRKFVTNFYSLTIVIGITSGLLLVSLRRQIAEYFSNPTINNQTLLLALLPLATAMTSSAANLLVSIGKIRLLIAYQVLYGTALLGSVALARYLNMPFSSYVAMFLLSHVLASWAVFILVARLVGFKWASLSFDTVREIFQFSIPLGLATAVGTLSLELDKLIVGRLSSTEAVAIYAVVGRELPFVIVATSLTAVVLPRLVVFLRRALVSRALEIWGASSLLAFTFLSFTASCLFIFAAEAVEVVYSEKYLVGVDVFRVYSLVLLFRFTYFGAILNAIGETRMILVSSAVSLFLNVCLSVLLFHWLGLVGPAVASLISIAGGQAFQLYLTARRIGVRLRDVMPWRSLARVATWNVAGALGAALAIDVLGLERWFGAWGEKGLIGVVWAIGYGLWSFKFLRLQWAKLNDKGQDP